MMKTVTVIDPKESVPKENKHLKVAAYCRVSTEYEEQISSLKSQVAHFSKLIQDNPDWEFAGIYAEQESGKNVDNRDELNRMLNDCDNGKIDLILTKSLSRFSRNTLDTLITLNQLAEKNIVVQFEMEGLNSMDKQMRQAIRMIAAMSQEESYSKSGNIKWGIRQSFRRGNVKLNYTNFLGYTKDDNGSLIIVEDEAKIVRLIYTLFLDGYGYRQIKKHLESNNIKTITGKDVWSTSTVDRILSNEKYVGRVISQKTYTKDFFTGKQVKNKGELPQYLIENNHDGIVSKDMFEMVQEEKNRRSIKAEQLLRNSTSTVTMRC